MRDQLKLIESALHSQAVHTQFKISKTILMHLTKFYNNISTQITMTISA